MKFKVCYCRLYPVKVLLKIMSHDRTGMVTPSLFVGGGLFLGRMPQNLKYRVSC